MERIGLAPGTEVGGYQVVAPLGRGGMGAVYRAVDGAGTQVALKLLHPHLAADPDARERLRREVQHLQRVRHEGVARVLDAEIESTEAFVVTELVDGSDLAAHVREHGPLPADELADLADQLREALGVVHAAGVLHRDLTPGNVLVSPRGAVLIDFGIAQAAEDPRVTSAGMVVGTPGYLSPELLEGAEPSEAADWWGWASVLAFAATGRPPFGHRPVQAVLARAREGNPDLAGLPPRVQAALRSALTVDPWRRQEPEAVVGELRLAAEGDLGTTAGAGEDEAGTAVLPTAHDGPGAADLGATARTSVVPPLGPDEGWDDDEVGWDEDAGWDEDRAAGTQVLDGPRTEVLGPADPGRTQVMPAADGYGYPASAPPGVAGAPGGAAGWPEDDAVPFPTPTTPRRRVGTVLAAATVLVVLGATRPVLALGVAVLLAVLVRSVGLDVEAVQARRRRRGPGSGDVVLATLSWPWYLVRAAAGVLPAAVLAGAVAVMVGGVGWWLLGTERLTLVEPAPGDPPGELGLNAAWVTPGLVGAVVALALVVLWFGPMARRTRRGARWTLRGIAPGPVGSAVATGVLLLGAVAVLQLVLLAPQGVPETVWWPWSGPPELR